MATNENSSWKWITGVSALGVIGITLAAGISGYWVLTALPVGFLFGFFLEKAELCGSSAFSEVLLQRDWKKMGGIWMVIVVSMLGFSLLSGMGLVKLSPKPLLWASDIIGGAIFGVGMVLAGACVSGSLFKTGQGNLNSMAALAGIPGGIMMVEYGSLNGWHKALAAHVVNNADGTPTTFASVLHISYPLLTVIFAALTLVAVVFSREKKSNPAGAIKSDDRSLLKKAMTRRWKPWQAGVAIGVLACLAYLSSAASGRNYPLGAAHGVMQAELLLTDSPIQYVIAPTPVAAPAPSTQTVSGKKVSLWLIFEVVSLILGAFVSAKLTGRAKLLPKPPGQTIIAFFGGLLVGIGAAIAGGCVVGNIMSGVALMSVGNLLFAVVVILSNWITTHFYLMGGSMKDLAWALNVFKK